MLKKPSRQRFEKQPPEVFYKKRCLFVKNSQNSEKNTCAKVSFLKKILWYRCFPVNFVKFLRTPFLQNTSGRRLLRCKTNSNTKIRLLSSIRTGMNKLVPLQCMECNVSMFVLCKVFFLKITLT